MFLFASRRAPLVSAPCSLVAATLASLMLLVLGAGTGRAQPVLDGFVEATAACPATPAIRAGDGADAVLLKPSARYRLLAENKVDGTHYLVIVPGASPERRWIERSCGTRVAAAEPSSPPSPPAAPAEGRADVAGQPPARVDRRTTGSRMIVAMNWQPAFCESSGRPECVGQTADRRDASNFSLHGLWPQPRGREFCGVSSALREADEGDWTALPAPDLSAATKARLADAMPGTHSGLDRHEWLRHGTCYGKDAEAYFADSLQVLDAVNASEVRALFADSVGKRLSRDEIRAAFEKSFGPGTGDRLRLTCRRDGGRELISEITLGLAGDIRPGVDLAALIRAAPKAGGGCEGGLVDGVGRQ